MDDLFTWLIIIFFLAPFVEKLFKRGGEKQAPRRPVPRRAPQRPRRPARDELEVREIEARGALDRARQRSRETSASTATGGAGSADPAAGMLPDDMWEILTGRAPVPTIPPPATPSDREESSLERVLEEIVVEPESAEEPVRVVSMETEPLPPEIRHERFHRRLERMSTERRDRPASVSRRRELRAILARPRSTRTAVLLAEILGPPGGIAGHDPRAGGEAATTLAADRPL